jgi:hypothetical protein
VERRIEQEGERAVESLGCYLGVTVIATVDIAETRLEGTEAYDRAHVKAVHMNGAEKHRTKHFQVDPCQRRSSVSQE